MESFVGKHEAEVLALAARVFVELLQERRPEIFNTLACEQLREAIMAFEKVMPADYAVRAS